ncbi:23S rRNA pseudouridine(2605) synthase RluB [Silvimonas iriomotensis]|uniref:Pseudouridine synthase n=1 Tax=Silvimonas iriomotensis TaxID=449662 RepID=A0ABQ2P6Y9_9NEIS|nr:pseudouridine synthase [Silvimonas iriomotensis]GGP19222.1 pseudouridine synthase [Silvimonas iriomotensis]
MKTTRARRPQPAIREQKTGQNQKAAAGVRRTRTKDTSDNWHSGPREETGARGTAPKAAPRSGPRAATTARPANTRPTGAAGAAAPGAETPASKPRTAKVSVTRAKKMLVRHGSAKQVETQKQLRAKRLTSDQVGEERLQKALAFSGWGSRREAETWVEQGRVSVNGKIAELGAKVKQGDDVRVDGKRVNLRWADRLPRIVMYHKQEGELVTRDDPQGRVTVFDRLPKLASSKWVAIGRLDFNTSGLLLFTTSGDLANRMMHPSFAVEREYAARILGELTGEQMNEMTRGIELDDGKAHFDHISDSGGEGVNHWYRVVLREGRNREVRRMFEHYELTVSRLMRVRYGMFHLPARLKRGQFYELNETEVLAAMKWADLRINGQTKDY